MQRSTFAPPRGGRSGRAAAAAFLFLSLACVPTAAAAAPTESIEQTIARAGNADDDADRLKILRELQGRSDLNARLASDLKQLIPEIELWLDSTRLTYFGREVSRSLDYDFRIAEDSPLYPITCIYRGRMLVWITLESGNIKAYPDRRRKFLDKAVANFKIARSAFPDNRIVRMYLGEPIPWPKTLAGEAEAPEWAALQRENLERLADIIRWWIDHRMQPNGEYGGGWGDDCEMWRWWTPVLIAFDDPKITAAQARFSDALMSQEHMKNGYTSRMTDVEHTAEDSADAITPMMHLDPDSPEWKGRALRLVDLMETLWTGRNQRGMLQFKSTYFTVDRVDSKPERACDTVYHPRALQPALLLWQRTGDPKLGALFSAWMDTWVDATARSQRGKPAGVLPSAIHWPDGAVGGLGPSWWDPRNHGEPTLYEWPSAARMMANTFLLTYHMTKKEKYLEPLRSMAAIRLKWLKGRRDGEPAPGSEAWCAARLGFLAPTLAKYKLLTGRSDFDELLAQDYPGLLLAGGDRSSLVDALRDSAQALRVNFAGYSNEVRWTDRVLRFPGLFEENYMFPEAIPSIKVPDPKLVYTAATGDPGDPGYFPMAAVRWRTPPKDIAALVLKTGSEQFRAELFHFGRSKRSMSADLYLLDPGRYQLELRREGGGALGPPQTLTATGARTTVSFTLPPRELCVLQVRPE